MKKIYKLFVSLSLLLISVALKINSHKLSAIIIWLNVRKLKAVKSTSKSQKK